MGPTDVNHWNHLTYAKAWRVREGLLIGRPLAYPPSRQGFREGSEHANKPWMGPGGCAAGNGWVPQCPETSLRQTFQRAHGRPGCDSWGAQWAANRVEP